MKRTEALRCKPGERVPISFGPRGPQTIVYGSELFAMRAQNAAQRALRDGVITKASACARCGSTDRLLEGHHDDYLFPLDVIWMCRSCHHRYHHELKRSGAETPRSKLEAEYEAALRAHRAAITSPPSEAA